MPLLFPNYPTSVIFGFLVSLAAGFIGMGILGAVNYPVVVFPALIPTFFTGAVTAIFGNPHRRNPGCVCRFVFERTHLDHRSGTSALRLIGTYAPIMRILSETDYLFIRAAFRRSFKTSGRHLNERFCIVYDHRLP